MDSALTDIDSTNRFSHCITNHWFQLSMNNKVTLCMSCLFCLISVYTKQYLQKHQRMKYPNYLKSIIHKEFSVLYGRHLDWLLQF